MDLFTLVAKLVLDSDQYDEKVKDAKKDAEGLGGKLASAAKIGGAAMVAGVGVAAAEVGKLAKQAVDAYADYEQLSGGIETLFGDSAKAVITSAEDAYKTAGMSMNEYMETTIGSAAAMISSLGGDQAEAAKLMDLSITDMSDNVNKMGTTMEAVQNAYRGFSRGNFTMLDNLALGYAGTKEGMQSLLDKAVELEAAQGRTAQFSIDSYADIVNAIHIVQTEMGITGTTADEAAGTISGSLATMKSAWQNLLTVVADGNGDMSKAVEGVVESASNVAKNIIPALKTALSGIGALVTELAPVIAKELPVLVKDVLPSLIDSAIQLAITLATALAENAPMIIETLLTAIISNAPKLLEGGIQIVVALVKGIVKAIPKLLTAAAQLFVMLLEEIGKGVVKFAEIGLKLVQGLWEGIKSAWKWLVDSVKNLFGGLIDGILSLLGIHSPSRVFANIGKQSALGFGEGFEKAMEGVTADVDASMDFGATGSKFGAVSMAQPQAQVVTPDIKIEFDGDLAQLARVLQPRIVSESTRQGNAFVYA